MHFWLFALRRSRQCSFFLLVLVNLSLPHDWIKLLFLQNLGLFPRKHPHGPAFPLFSVHSVPELQTVAGEGSLIWEGLSFGAGFARGPAPGRLGTRAPGGRAAAALRSLRARHAGLPAGRGAVPAAGRGLRRALPSRGPARPRPRRPLPTIPRAATPGPREPGGAARGLGDSPRALVKAARAPAPPASRARVRPFPAPRSSASSAVACRKWLPAGRGSGGSGAAWKAGGRR